MNIFWTFPWNLPSQYGSFVATDIISQHVLAPLTLSYGWEIKFPHGCVTSPGSPRKFMAEQRSELKRSSFLPFKYELPFIHSFIQIKNLNTGSGSYKQSFPNYIAGMVSCEHHASGNELRKYK